MTPLSSLPCRLAAISQAAPLAWNLAWASAASFGHRPATLCPRDEGDTFLEMDFQTAESKLKSKYAFLKVRPDAVGLVAPAHAPQNGEGRRV